MRIYSKRISERFLSLNVNVNSNLKLLRALGVLSKGNQTLGHSEGTWALGHSGTQRGLRQSEDSWASEHLKGTRALTAIRHSSTYGTLFSRLSNQQPLPSFNIHLENAFGGASYQKSKEWKPSCFLIILLV